MRVVSDELIGCSFPQSACCVDEILVRPSYQECGAL
jgi:hypothetical protein